MWPAPSSGLVPAATNSISLMDGAVMHSYHWLLLWGCLVGSPLLAAPPTCRSLDPLLYLAFVAEPLSPERFFNLEQTQGPPDVLRQRAAVLMSLGRWFDAATLVQALPADDLSADTALLAALLAFHQGAFAEAQEQFTAAERSYRQADQARPTLLAVGAWALNQRQYPRYPPSPGPATPAATVMTALVSAELALFHGDAAAAADHLDALSPTQQQSPMVLAMTARIALCRGDDPTPLLDALQRRDPNTVDEALWRGDWAWRQGNRVAARQFYDQARQRREEDGRVWLRLGLLDQYDGETRQALDKLHRALALNPAGVGYLGEMALLLTRLGRFRDAERDLHAHLAQFPTDAVALMALGYWHLRQGDDGAALGWLRQSLDADPHETRALSYAAIALYRLKQPDAALALLAQAHGDVQSRLTTDPLSWQVATRIQREQNQLLSGLHSAAQTVAAWEQRLPLEAWAMNAGLTDPGATAARWELTALAFAQSLATEQNPLLWATLGATRDFREQAQRLGRFRDPLTVGEDPLRDDILRRANALTTATVAVEGQAAAWGPRLGVSHRGLAAGETVAYAAEGAMTRFQDGGHRWQVGGEVGAVNLGRLSGFSGVQRQQLDLDDQTARQHQVFLGGQLDLSATQQLGVLAQQDLTIYEQRTAVTDYNSQQLWTLGLRQTNPGIQWGVSYQQLRQQRDASGADSRDQERQREQLWTGWLDGQRRDFLAGVTVQAGIAVQNIQRQDALTTADAEVVATRTVVQTESRLGPRLGVAWQATAADVLRMATAPEPICSRSPWRAFPATAVMWSRGGAPDGWHWRGSDNGKRRCSRGCRLTTSTWTTPSRQASKAPKRSGCRICGSYFWHRPSCGTT